MNLGGGGGGTPWEITLTLFYHSVNYLKTLNLALQNASEMKIHNSFFIKVHIY
jgi:hypothetical protein